MYIYAHRIPTTSTEASGRTTGRGNVIVFYRQLVRSLTAFAWCAQRRASFGETSTGNNVAHCQEAGVKIHMLLNYLEIQFI